MRNRRRIQGLFTLLNVIISLELSLLLLFFHCSWNVVVVVVVFCSSGSGGDSASLGEGVYEGGDGDIGVVGGGRGGVCEDDDC